MNLNKCVCIFKLTWLKSRWSAVNDTSCFCRFVFCLLICLLVLFMFAFFYFLIIYFLFVLFLSVQLLLPLIFSVFFMIHSSEWFNWELTRHYGWAEMERGYLLDKWNSFKILNRNETNLKKQKAKIYPILKLLKSSRKNQCF